MLITLRTASAETLIEMKLLRAGRCLNEQPAFAKATAGESGEGGIRTRDTLASIQTFQACSFDHSDTSPDNLDGKCNKFLLHLRFICNKFSFFELIITS